MFDEPRTRWTTTELISTQAARLGGRPAVDFELGGPLSFIDLLDRSNALASRFAGAGVTRGDRVLALVPNRAEAFLAMLATHRLGAIWVPINTELKGPLLEHQVRNSDPRLVVVDRRLAGLFEGVTTSEEAVLSTVVLVGDEPLDHLPAVLERRHVIAIDELPTGPSVEEIEPPAYNDIACIMYTSGTTGPAKGVLMPHAHCVLFGMGTVRAADLTSADIYYICMPLFHANALLMQLVGALIAGARARVVERFSPNRWLDEIRACGATVTNGLGVMPEFIFTTTPTDRDRDHSLRAMMAVPISDEWAHDFVDRFGVRIFQGFGMTECNIPFYTDPSDPLVGGMAGHLLDDWFEAMIVDPDTDEPLPTGSTGELVIRPREPSCFMAGYFRMPERTVEAWRNLWFHTGDACFFDTEGRMHFVDRLKDCIRRRGENISSFEVEQVLNRHPDVAESVVVGVRVAGAGGEEEVKACVVVRPGADLSPERVLDFCVSNLPRYAVPRFVELIATVPKTATGKVQKQHFKDAGVTDRTWDRDEAGYTIPR